MKKAALRLLRELTIVSASTVGTWLFRALAVTMRFRVEGLEFYRTKSDIPEPTVFAFWHDQLVALLALGVGRRRRFAALISRHQDADAVARVAAGLGLVPVRGSSSRGGLEAMGELVRHLRGGDSVVFTPDGPRGPRHEPGEGSIVLAHRAGVRIVPVGCAVRPRLRAGSWDRLQVPLPFARVTVVEGEALRVPHEADASRREEIRQELGRRLEELTARAEGLTVTDLP